MIEKTSQIRLMIEQLPQIFLADHALYLENGSLRRSSDKQNRFVLFLDSNLISRHPGDTMENLLEQLKLISINGISRKQADQWRRRWFRVYTYRGSL